MVIARREISATRARERPTIVSIMMSRNFSLSLKKRAHNSEFYTIEVILRAHLRS